jgi:hypothetical protein
MGRPPSCSELCSFLLAVKSARSHQRRIKRTTTRTTKTARTTHAQSGTSAHPIDCVLHPRVGA